MALKKDNLLVNKKSSGPHLTTKQSPFIRLYRCLFQSPSQFSPPLKRPIHPHHIPERCILVIAVGGAVNEEGEVNAEGEGFGFFEYAPAFYGEGGTQAGIYAEVAPKGGGGNAVHIGSAVIAEFGGTGICKTVKVYVQPVAGEAWLVGDVIFKTHFHIYGCSAPCLVTFQYPAVPFIGCIVAGKTAQVKPAALLKVIHIVTRNALIVGRHKPYAAGEFVFHHFLRAGTGQVQQAFLRQTISHTKPAKHTGANIELAQVVVVDRFQLHIGIIGGGIIAIQ